MTEAPKKIWAQQSATGWDEPVSTPCRVEHFHLYHHDAEVQRLVAEARAKAFEEAANVVGDRRDANTAIWEKTGNPGWLAVLAHLDQARDAILALSDAPPRQVTPQEAAKVLLDHWYDDKRRASDEITGEIEKMWRRHSLPETGLYYILRALANGGDSDE